MGMMARIDATSACSARRPVSSPGWPTPSACRRSSPTPSWATSTQQRQHHPPRGRGGDVRDGWPDPQELRRRPLHQRPPDADLHQGVAATQHAVRCVREQRPPAVERPAADGRPHPASDVGGRGLRGANAAEAYYIRCDETLNTLQVISSGEVRMEIGVALEYPAEFVVIRITQYDRGSFTAEVSRRPKEVSQCQKQPIDPLRNFKFNVQASHGEHPDLRGHGVHVRRGHRHEHGDGPVPRGRLEHRPHKLPGQTDFAPLTMSAGVFLRQERDVGSCASKCSPCSTATARWR